MYVKKLLLHNYRSYKHLKFEPEPGLNIIIGDNAAGKTNLLESLYYLASGSSSRTHRDSELVKWGSDGFRVQATVDGSTVKHTLQFSYRSDQGKKYKLDGVEQDRLREVLGVINAVIFSPDDLVLVKGAPKERRDFLNAEISQVNPRYQSDISQYKRVIRQRNDVLKKITASRSSKETADLTLEPWDRQLIDRGREIITSRIKMLHAWGKYSCANYKKLTEGRETLSIAYRLTLEDDMTLLLAGKEVDQSHADLSGSNNPGRRALRTRVGELLESSIHQIRKDEMKRGYTMLGPHRDDIVFYVDRRPARLFSSQGQQRSVALALKIGEVEWIMDQTGKTPLLLLDDVMSELDVSRAERLARLVGIGGQTFITCTDLGDLDMNQLEGTLWRVESGDVVRVG